MQKDELLYFAGIVDGEGCICIFRTKTDKIEYKALCLAIVNTDKRLIDWLVKTFNGKFNTVYPKIEKQRTRYQWSLFGSKAQEILVKVEPYLKLKGEQARLALQFPVGKPGVRLTSEVISKRNEIGGKVKALNKGVINV